MSGARVRFLPEARREAGDAFDWYRERSVQAAEGFLHELDTAVALISTAPSIWPSYELGARVYVLRRFPYNIIYREAEGGIEVVAVAHHKRRPRYWRRRLAPKAAPETR